MIKIYIGFRGPQCLLQFLPCDQISGPLEKHLQDLKGLARQAKPHSVLLELLRLQVSLKRAKGDHDVCSLIYRHFEKPCLRRVPQKGRDTDRATEPSIALRSKTSHRTATV